MSNHHPFTSPASDDLDPATAKATAYDLVLNGFEVGGGSIRIHRPEVQRKVFEVLGLSEVEIEEKFGHFDPRVPVRRAAPRRHRDGDRPDRDADGGPGRDPGRPAFPKAQSGADLLTGAPARSTRASSASWASKIAPPPSEEE